MVLISLLLSFLIYDDAGEKLLIRAPPQRVVSLAPNITDFLVYLELKNRIVGKTYIDRIQAENVINESGFLSREKILKLRPDIVFAGDINSKEDIEWMRKNQINVFYLSTKSISEISSALIKISRIFGIEEKGLLKLKKFLDMVFKEKVKFKGYALLIIDSKGGIWCAGKNTFLDEMLGIAGFKNSVDFFEGYKMISSEKIDFEKVKYFILAHPDILDDLKVYPFYKKMKGKIYLIQNWNYLTKPSPYIYMAIEELKKIR